MRSRHLPAIIVTIVAFVSPTVRAQSYDPPGTLYDNQVANLMFAVVSQNSSGVFLARAADDFTLDGAGCPTNVFNISRIRVQIVQPDDPAQPCGLEIYASNDAGNAPTPATSIVPIASFTQTTKQRIGDWGTGSSLFEVSFDTSGLRLSGGTDYWLSALGTDADANASGMNSFFATSAGAAGTSPNAVFFAPGFDVPFWARYDEVFGGSPLAFSFAIDGVCAPQAEPIPTTGTTGRAILIVLLGLMGAVLAWRFALRS